MTAPVDLIIYGMGEVQTLELLKYARRNIPLGKVKDIKGTAYKTTLQSASSSVRSAVLEHDKTKFNLISSHARVSTDKKSYMAAFLAASKEQRLGVIQKQDNEHFVVVNPPSELPSSKLLDRVSELGYERTFHHKYAKGVPAIEEVKFSVVAHRGCFGRCSFCALNYHQGNSIVARSKESILREIEHLTTLSGFKGYIHDIGGPSANFHSNQCSNSSKENMACAKKCVGFSKCKNLNASHREYLDILRAARKVKGVKKVFVRSGVRFDFCNADSNKEFINELAAYHVSGQLKVAPEHVSDTVLSIMNKPPHKEYLKFKEAFNAATKNAKLEQYLVPYYMSSHPGCTLKDAIKLTEYLMSINYCPEQVQDFYPTPASLSTAMYYTELDENLKPIYVAKDIEEKAMQRALMQYRLAKNKHLVTKALKLAKREDLLPKIKFFK